MLFNQKFEGQRFDEGVPPNQNINEHKHGMNFTYWIGETSL